MTQPAIFEAIADSGPEASMGKLLLELSAANRRLILDGPAHLTGAMDLFEERSEFIDPPLFTFPVTFYAPKDDVLTVGQLGQLFHDFNFRSTKIGATQAVALDKSDSYIQLANSIGHSCTIQEAEGMEERAASLGTKSSTIVVQRVLLRFVRGVCEGRSFQERNLSRSENPNLTTQSRQSIQNKLENSIGAFAEGMGGGGV